MKFDYFYGAQANQFNFIKIPTPEKRTARQKE